MANGNEELELKLRRLTQAYAEDLPVKIQEIAAGWLILKSGWKSIVADEVYRSTHSLSGSSGSYGAMEVHTLSRQLEKAILAIIEAERPPSGNEIAEIDSLIGLIAEAANTWIATIPSAEPAEESSASSTEAPTPGAEAEVKNNGSRNVHPADNGEKKEKRMLYVEDNKANLNLVKQLIHVRWPDAELLLAEDPVAGLELIGRHQFDVVLLDINLPTMSGYQVLAQIRDNEQTRDIPVVAVSANAMPADIQSGLDAGFDEYITKPIKIEEFYEIIDQILAQKSG